MVLSAVTALALTAVFAKRMPITPALSPAGESGGERALAGLN
jgi:hypothetical protein